MREPVNTRTPWLVDARLVHRDFSFLIGHIGLKALFRKPRGYLFRRCGSGRTGILDPVHGFIRPHNEDLASTPEAAAAGVAEGQHYLPEKS